MKPLLTHLALIRDLESALCSVTTTEAALVLQSALRTARARLAELEAVWFAGQAIQAEWKRGEGRVVVL